MHTVVTLRKDICVSTNRRSLSRKRRIRERLSKDIGSRISPGVAHKELAEWQELQEGPRYAPGRFRRVPRSWAVFNVLFLVLPLIVGALIQLVSLVGDGLGSASSVARPLIILILGGVLALYALRALRRRHP